jgi:hypothetical protein
MPLWGKILLAWPIVSLIAVALFALIAGPRKDGV